MNHEANIKHKILVVDDDADMRLLLRDFLTKQGYEVATADSAISALRLITSDPAQYRPDLIISDVKMGSFDGIAFMKKVLIVYPKLPVMLFSIYGRGDLQEEALKNGARHFLPKPFSLGELANLVRQEFEKK